MKEFFKNYTSKGRHIAKSSHHKDLFIITHEDGFHFHAISSSEEQIKQNYPPDSFEKKRVKHVVRKAA